MYLKDKTYKEQRVIEKRKKEALLSLYNEESENIVGLLRGQGFDVDQNRLENAFIEVIFNCFIVQGNPDGEWPWLPVEIKEGRKVQISGKLKKIIKI